MPRLRRTHTEIHDSVRSPQSTKTRKVITMMTELPNIAIVGATGVVGQEMLALIEERQLGYHQIRLLASAGSAGRVIQFQDEEIVVEELTADSFAGVDVAFFSAGGSVSKKFAPLAVAAGATVIDNSSAFRLDQRFALVIPEINASTIKARTIIANPNCSTIIMLMGITPIRELFKIKRVAVSTYQAVSGAGAAAMVELTNQTRAILAGDEPKCAVFDDVCAFNVFSHDTAIGGDGYNVEERKMIDETRKIWEDPAMAITATCIRVPVMRTHCESINLTFDVAVTEADLDTIRSAIAAFPGVQLVDDRVNNRFPTPRLASGIDDVLVGRLRLDQSQMNAEGSASSGVELFVAGDQLRKGAALNAIQIAECLLAGNAG